MPQLNGKEYEQKENTHSKEREKETLDKDN